MNTHESYVSLETAKMLKKAGFDWEVNHSYPDCESLDNSCSGYMEDLKFYHNLNDGKYGGMSAPTLEVAQRWLREVKHIAVNVTYFVMPDITYKWQLRCVDMKSMYVLHIEYFGTYEEAQEAGIKKALELILEKGE